MPLYPYSCTACEYAFESYVPSAKAAADVRCPACDSAELKREFSLPARSVAMKDATPMNCRGDGPPCGLSACGRRAN